MWAQNSRKIQKKNYCADATANPQSSLIIGFFFNAGIDLGKTQIIVLTEKKLLVWTEMWIKLWRSFPCKPSHKGNQVEKCRRV
jgi:hypothetical protein